MNIIKLLIFTLIFNQLLTSCRTTTYNSTDYQNLKSKNLNLQENFDSNFKETKRKNITSISLDLIVKYTDTANFHIEKITKRHDGYINEIKSSKTIIRVKEPVLNKVINEISKLGEIKNKNILGIDVSEKFLDSKIRLENAESSRNRYLELLAKAENVEAALKVEKELERLNTTIDILKGKINRINHLSEFSTINITLKEKKKPGIIGYIGIGLYHTVKWMFVRN